MVYFVLGYFGEDFVDCLLVVIVEGICGIVLYIVQWVVGKLYEYGMLVDCIGFVLYGVEDFGDV